MRIYTQPSSPMNEGQLMALERFREGKNIFLTGSAGTGKTFTLTAMKRAAHAAGKNIGVTATTGSAAILIGGRTIHSFLGIGLAKESAQALAMSVLTSRSPFSAALLSKIRSLDILVIEEISMMDAVLFDKISDYLCLLRDYGCGGDEATTTHADAGKSKTRTFGGLQMVLLGDMFQLPPVRGEYCFKSRAWLGLEPEIVMLTKLMRQKDDENFQRILEEVRWGSCSKETLSQLEGLTRTEFEHAVEPTILFCRNVNVDAINDTKFKELVDGSSGVSVVPIRTMHSCAKAKTWAAGCKIPDVLEICKGAQVVVTWNISQDSGVVNGTRGVVKHISASCDCVTLEVKDGRQIFISPITIKDEDAKHVWVTFMPLKLAWAITVHRSQGMTLDAVVLALGDVFEYGQAYTALSRVRDLKCVRLLTIRPDSFRTHPDVLRFAQSFLLP